MFRKRRSNHDATIYILSKKFLLLIKESFTNKQQTLEEKRKTVICVTTLFNKLILDSIST
jgi:hypothetical protein